MPETTKSSQSRSIRIAIADQQPIFRHGLRRLLETDPRLVIVSETGDGAATVTVIRDLRPDILLLGLSASGRRAIDIDTLRELAAAGDLVRTGQNTIKSHLTRIFNKMGASNRVELVQFAAHHRLLDVV